MGNHPRRQDGAPVEIGEPRRTYTIEPIEDPVPRERPAPERDPERVPEELPDREEVPAP
jgi:hypothetical protein